MAADAVDRVVRTGGVPYLVPQRLPWWQLHMLDVYATLLGASGAAVLAAAFIVHWVLMAAQMAVPQVWQAGFGSIKAKLL